MADTNATTTSARRRIRVRVQSHVHATLFAALDGLSVQEQRQTFHDHAFSAALLFEVLMARDPTHPLLTKVLPEARRSRLSRQGRANAAVAALDVRIYWNSSASLPLVHEKLQSLPLPIQSQLLLALAAARSELWTAVVCGRIPEATAPSKNPALSIQPRADDRPELPGAPALVTATQTTSSRGEFGDVQHLGGLMNLIPSHPIGEAELDETGKCENLKPPLRDISMNHLSARSSALSTASSRTTYLDMNPAVAQDQSTDIPWSPESLHGTPAAPILEDVYCRDMIVVGVAAYLESIGFTAKESRLPLQAWAERYVRRMGLAGTPVPSSAWGKIALRAKVLFQGTKITRRDYFDGWRNR